MTPSFTFLSALSLCIDQFDLKKHRRTSEIDQMKIQCDVCDKAEATLFCMADEAALCDACDRAVHHANKLAGKHQRFSLLQPSSKQTPLCDICQEKRGLLFCQQDRAILCKECDESIHRANQYTSKHNRFLVTGVKLSSTSSLYSSSISSSSKSTPSADSNLPINSQNSIHCTSISAAANAASTSPVIAENQSNTHAVLINGGSGHDFSTSSSISEYLIEMLPGWHVEDLLDSSSSCSAYGLQKLATENDVMPFWDADDNMRSNIVTPDNMGSCWVPQSQGLQDHDQSQKSQLFSFPNSINMAFWDTNPMGMMNKESKQVTNIKSSRKRSPIDENSFAVPQINSHSKKSKTFC